MKDKVMPNPQEDELHIEMLPDIFRSIGPGDDVVVSAEKMQEHVRQYAAKARIDELEQHVDLINEVIADAPKSATKRVFETVRDRNLRRIKQLKEGQV